MKVQNDPKLKTIKVVGIAADHDGHELKNCLTAMLRDAGAEVIDFGDKELLPEDDYADFVIPLAQAVAAGQVDRGVAICGSGVGACVVANKVNGVRACLSHDPSTVHQGVEDDDLNLLCLGGLEVGQALAWELVRRFLVANFLGKERHRSRLKKVADLENSKAPDIITAKDAARQPCGSAVEDLPLKIYLVRHGETEWTFSHRYSGLTDIPLTAQVEDRVREWGRCFLDIPFSHVLTSPRQRARRTCELVGLADAAEIDEDLAEWNYGDYEGKRSVDIRERRPTWNVFHDGCPNGESPAQVSDRADRLITRIRSLTGNVALFSHGQFGSVLAARWIGLPVIHGRHFPLDTASLGILKNDPHHPEVPVIVLWNSAPHEASHQNSVAPNPELSVKPCAIQRWDNEGGETPDTSPTSDA